MAINNGGINWNAVQQLTQNRMQQVLQPSTVPQAVLPALAVIFVKGRKGVDEFAIPPNCSGVPLFDEVTGELYIKSSDAYGNCKVVEFEPPVPKQTEADKQKALLVSMDERMTRLEDAIAKLVEGGNNNGKPYSGGNEQSKRAKQADKSDRSEQ